MLVRLRINIQLRGLNVVEQPSESNNTYIEKSLTSLGRSLSIVVGNFTLLPQQQPSRPSPSDPHPKCGSFFPAPSPAST